MRCKMFVCKSKRLANYLIDNGLQLKRIDSDQRSKGFLVFLFERNKLLDNVLNKWKLDKMTYLIS